jgi:hypothetical protein
MPKWIAVTLAWAVESPTVDLLEKLAAALALTFGLFSAIAIR